jgi:hypothetical protein
MSRPLLLVVALSLAGCAGRREEAPPPEPLDSEADLARFAVRDAESRGLGYGHPGRLPAGTWRVARGAAEVRVDYAGIGDLSRPRTVIQVAVRNRGPAEAIRFGDWARPEQVALRDDRGTAYPLLPLPPDRVEAIRRGEAERPDLPYRFGAGPVTRGHFRYAALEFDPQALYSDYLDLDLSGESVGSADPILFRIPWAMTVKNVGMAGR